MSTFITIQDAIPGRSSEIPRTDQILPLLRFGTCTNILDHNVVPREVDFSAFAREITQPPALLDKKVGRAAVFATFEKRYAVNKNVTACTALVLDIERPQSGTKKPPIPDLAEETLTKLGVAYVLWTTHSHTAQEPRYRVVFPLSGVLPPNLLKMAYSILMKQLLPFDGVIDESCFHPARLFILPCVHPERTSHFETKANIQGKWIRADRFTEVSKIQLDAENWNRKQLASDKLLPPVQRENIISEFNKSISVKELLQRAGYVPKGERWLSPQSCSGIPGVVVFEAANRVFSHHHGDALNDGHSHDAFSVYTIIWHCGDSKSAYAAIKKGLYV
jgi:hypothetical protein